MKVENPTVTIIKKPLPFGRGFFMERLISVKHLLIAASSTATASATLLRQSFNNFLSQIGW
jgi:hypothetical protein